MLWIIVLFVAALTAMVELYLDRFVPVFFNKTRKSRSYGRRMRVRARIRAKRKTRGGSPWVKGKYPKAVKIARPSRRAQRAAAKVARLEKMAKTATRWSAIEAASVSSVTILAPDWTPSMLAGKRIAKTIRKRMNRPMNAARKRVMRINNELRQMELERLNQKAKAETLAKKQERAEFHALCKQRKEEKATEYFSNRPALLTSEEKTKLAYQRQLMRETASQRMLDAERNRALDAQTKMLWESINLMSEKGHRIFFVIRDVNGRLFVSTCNPGCSVVKIINLDKRSH